MAKKQKEQSNFIKVEELVEFLESLQGSDKLNMRALMQFPKDKLEALLANAESIGPNPRAVEYASAAIQVKRILLALE